MKLMEAFSHLIQLLSFHASNCFVRYKFSAISDSGFSSLSSFVIVVLIVVIDQKEELGSGVTDGLNVVVGLNVEEGGNVTVGKNVGDKVIVAGALGGGSGREQQLSPVQEGESSHRGLGVGGGVGLNVGGGIGLSVGGGVDDLCEGL
eukprot:CAMPEP_0170791514 /NCGR_PEP_ID=MMETSP0733-20121128/21194_2 /TAXON_ID=186038 /ORGANISM="Fragilariopsis kerguelensis, Strain L26-C5" /LENGTH=146 /DNA_ID=CAMNT_0011139467 /DNA_START=109 /DNA_END=548 /DNA_ORIENTATION=-